ncbi:hypothetical protein INR49_013466 [Caranx melampygus]|nr:hypothetical protein INR49_013466 [Caranx melampygus]
MTLPSYILTPSSFSPPVSTTVDFTLEKFQVPEDQEKTFRVVSLMAGLAAVFSNGEAQATGQLSSELGMRPKFTRNIVTTGDLNPSLDIRLIFAKRFAPTPLPRCSIAVDLHRLSEKDLMSMSYSMVIV